jgi:hypothetical protein
MIPTEIALCFKGIGSIPPTQNVTYNPNWWRKRSANVQDDSKKHASLSLVFRILQLIRQEPQHTRNVGMSEIDEIEQVIATNDEYCRKDLDVKQTYLYPGSYPLCQLILTWERSDAYTCRC